MNRLIRTELLKQRTTRTFVAGVTGAPVVAALITIAILSLSGQQGNDPLSPDSLVHIVGAPAAVIALVAVVLGVLGMAGEYRHRTITTTFLATPRRRDVVVAKIAAHAVTGALMGVLSLVVSTAIAVPWLYASDVVIRVDGRTATVAAGLIVSTALYGALGVAVGALLRNQTTAAAVVLVWLLAVEGLVADLLRGAGLARWLPAAAGRALVHTGDGGDGLAVPVAAAIFILYVVTLAAAGTRLTLRRDIA
jgi:ABC-2 type transport system permease protein